LVVAATFYTSVSLSLDLDLILAGGDFFSFGSISLLRWTRGARHLHSATLSKPIEQVPHSSVSSFHTAALC
jgi:hypothetical protein